MCKQVSYSKYQKRVIRFLTEFLGVHTPFSYERTQTNHLKVLIDGVPKPLYTGSTPSDIKSFINFTAEVKREVRAAMAPSLPQTEEVSQSNASNAQSSTPVCFERLIQTCTKMLRTRLDVMKIREEARVLEAGKVEVATQYRADEVKQAIKLALQARKPTGYIKPKEMKAIETAVIKHLNFMLPTLAQYAEMISRKSKQSTLSCSSIVTAAKVANDDVIGQEHPSSPVLELKPTSPQVVVPKAAKVKPMSKALANAPALESANKLMAMNAQDRISLLRGLSKTEAECLMFEIQHAMALNLEQDIAAVVALIREKDLPLEAIIAGYEAA